jgi:hypothetical protein
MYHVVFFMSIILSSMGGQGAPPGTRRKEDKEAGFTLSFDEGWRIN